MFTEDQLTHLSDSVIKIPKQSLEVGRKWTSLKLNNHSREYAIEGFLRRIFTISRCIDQVFEKCPPDIQMIEDEPLTDTKIFLQAFIFNAFGALENLGHVIDKEYKLNLHRNDIGLLPISKFSKIKRVLDEPLISDLEKYEKAGWTEYLINYRHALAHRIPLYIPPYIVDPKDEDTYRKLSSELIEAELKGSKTQIQQITLQLDEIKSFRPMIGHSFSEKHNRMIFHYQIIVDWNTIMNISNHVHRILETKPFDESK